MNILTYRILSGRYRKHTGSIIHLVNFCELSVKLISGLLKYLILYCILNKYKHNVSPAGTTNANDHLAR